MHLLPPSLSLPLTWGLCALLAAFLFRGWFRAAVKRTLNEVKWENSALHRMAERSARGRLDHLLHLLRERVFHLCDAPLTGYAMFRAVLRALIAVPLAIIAAKVATDDAVFGVFLVLREQPEAVERVGRCLLILLLYAALVTGFPRYDAWFNGLIRQAGAGRRAKLLRNLRQMTLAGVVMAFFLTGVTAGFLLFLVVMTLVGAVMAAKGASNVEPEHVPLLHTALQAALVLGCLAVFLGIHLVWTPVGGFIAVALLPGLILPLAVAPALFVALAGADHLVHRIMDRGLGFARVAAWWVGSALASLALLAAGLAAGLWLGSIVLPANYRPDLQALWAGLWSDPAMGGPIWILAAVTVWPLVAIPVEGLAREVAHRSPLRRRALTLLGAKARAEAVAQRLVWAEVTGWGAVLSGLCALLAGLAAAGP